MKSRIFVSRNKHPLPTYSCEMEIILYDFDGSNTITIEAGQWVPFNKEDYTEETMPGEGYLGTLKGEYGYHAWQQNNSEFEYYRIINNV